jgi:hypothetical protein
LTSSLFFGIIKGKKNKGRLKTMIFNTTVKEYKRTLTKEIKFQMQHQDTNTNKKLTALRLTMQLADSVPQDLIVKGVESVKNTGKVKRDFEMFNLGSFCETIMGYHKRPYKVKTMQKSLNEHDYKDFEFKISLSGTCKNTPIKPNDVKVILINQLGAFKLVGKEIQEHCDKYGRLPNNKAIGLRDDRLSQALGF